MHEYQRTVVEKNNELVLHVIIIHVFDKSKRKGDIRLTKERRAVWKKGRQALLISVSAPLESQRRVASASGPTRQQ